MSDPRLDNNLSPLEDEQHARSLRFYRDQAKDYFESTAHLDLAEVRAKLTQRVPPGARLLDAGCGSGRDAKAFAEAGFEVEAFDASPELVALARQHTGLPVECTTFDQLDEASQFDAVWACSSLVHLNAEQLAKTLAKLARMLRPGGWLYTNFKTGNSPEVAEDGRKFYRATESEVRQLLAAQGLLLDEIWVSGSLRSSSVQWLNVLAKSAPLPSR